jgi:hypothetical protein
MATTAVTFHFSVFLDKAPVTDISIHYTTVASTAEENKDYIPVSGTLTIPSGQKRATVDVYCSYTFFVAVTSIKNFGNFLVK